MQVFLYWLGTQAYFLAIRLVALWKPKAKLAIEGRRNLLKHIATQLKNEQRPRIWMHCASLGEFEQGRPVLEKLRKEYPRHALVLSFFSPSGYEVRKDYKGADYVCYLPFDSPSNSEQFVALLNPKLAIIVKYEYWYFLLNALNKKKVPSILIAARFLPKQPFFQWYGSLHRKMLGMFTHLFVQDEESKALLKSLNITNVTIAGDPRFDRVIQIASEQKTFPIADSFCADGKPVLVAGSTWAEDEEMLSEAWKELGKNWKMILVPHEVHDTHIDALRSKFGAQTALWSDGMVADDKQVLIVDTVGYLSGLYRYGKVAYIGGGFGKEGIHNVLEAAVYGMPCLHGPVYQQYLEAVDLVQVGGSHVITSSTELVRQMDDWQKDAASYTKAANAASKYVHAKGGATEIIMAYLRAKNSFSTL